MKIFRFDKDELKQWFSDRSDRALNGFLEAIADDFFSEFITSENIADIRIEGDAGKPFLPFSKMIFVPAEGSNELDSTETYDVITLPGVIQRVVDPISLLRSIYPILNDRGKLIISVPMRDVFEAKYQIPSYHEPHRHKRFYTISSFFLELQAAWGFNTFRISFAKDYDGVPAGHGVSDHFAFSLIIVIEKRDERKSYSDVPQIEITKARDLYNRDDEEELLSIDASSILSPRLLPDDIRKICVIKLDHIGDFVMAVPIFDEIRSSFPSAEITCVCGSWNEGLARALNCFERVVVCDYYKEDEKKGGSSAETKMIAAQRLGAELSDTKFDLAIDLRIPQDSRNIIETVSARYRAATGNIEDFPFLDVALPSFEAFRRNLQLDPEASYISIPANAFRFRDPVPSPPGIQIVNPVIDKDKFIFGPYIPFKRGSYRLTWLMNSIGDTVNVLIDAALHDPSRNGVDVLREVMVEVGPAGTVGTLEFELYIDVSEIEFRAWMPPEHKGATLVFGGVRLEHISGRPAVRHMPPAQVHIKEQMALLLALVRSRLFAPARTPEAIREAVRAVAAVPSSPYFVMVPFSNSEVRDWPLEGYASLCKLLLEETSASIRLIGARSQSAQLDALAACIGLDAANERVENHAGRPWEEVYTSFVQAEAVITNNSGMAHLAAMLGGRVLALYSGSHQVLEWGPVGPEVTALQASLPCGACGFDTSRECLHGLRCLQIISPPAVLRNLRQFAPDTFFSRAPQPME